MHFSAAMISAFGPFQLLRELGKGELGEVFFARTPWKTTRCAALKRLRPERTASASFSGRFRRSMRITKGIDHANLVPLFDSGAIDGSLYTCSQLIPGRGVLAISDRLARRGVGAPAAIGLRVLTDMLSALARIEGLIAHGGLPRNVIVGWDGTARLSDLGLPRDHPIPDLVGLGIAVRRLFVGRETLVPLSELRPDLPEWIAGLITLLIDNRDDTSATTLMRTVTQRAHGEGLLLPHSAVASWLAELFGAERDRELGEVERSSPFEFESTVLAKTVVMPARIPGFAMPRTPGVWTRAPSRTEDEHGGAAW